MAGSKRGSSSGGGGVEGGDGENDGVALAQIIPGMVGEVHGSDVFHDASDAEAFEDLNFTTKNAGLYFGIMSIVFPTITFCITYAVSISNKTARYPYYFLSSTIDFPPGSNIGSFGLGLSSIVFFIWPFVRFLCVKWALANRAPHGRRVGLKICGKMRLANKGVRVLNTVSLVLGSAAAIGALGVASFQAHADLTVHLVFAGIFFVCGGAYVALQMLMDFVLPSATYTERKIRLAVISLFPIMFVVGLIIHSKYAAGEAFDRKDIIFLGAIAEITTLVLYMIFLGTFIPSYAHLRVNVTFAMSEERMRKLARTNPDTISDLRHAVTAE